MERFENETCREMCADKIHFFFCFACDVGNEMGCGRQRYTGRTLYRNADMKIDSLNSDRFECTHTAKVQVGETVFFVTWRRHLHTTDAEHTEHFQLARAREWGMGRREPF